MIPIELNIVTKITSIIIYVIFELKMGYLQLKHIKQFRKKRLMSF
jgi:hypothetical protein